MISLQRHFSFCDSTQNSICNPDRIRRFLSVSFGRGYFQFSWMLQWTLAVLLAFSFCPFCSLKLVLADGCDDAHRPPKFQNAASESKFKIPVPSAYCQTDRPTSNSPVLASRIHTRTGTHCLFFFALEMFLPRFVIYLEVSKTNRLRAN